MTASECSTMLPIENPVDEKFALNQRDFRLVLKLATILRNQEYNQFYQKQLERMKKEDSEIVERR
jgi:hypothetical protein